MSCCLCVRARVTHRTHPRLYMFLKKEDRGWEERGEGGHSGGKGEGSRLVRVRPCLKRNIFLYYYSRRAYFSYPPTCIPGGWVCSFFVSLSLSFFHSSLYLFPSARVCLSVVSLFSLSLSLLLLFLVLQSSLFLPLFAEREKFNPERALFPFYARIATRNCAARPAARKNTGGKRSASIKRSLLPPPTLAGLSRFAIERRLLPAL